jgi:hypothetical protein
VCRNSLLMGERWGCGKRFSRSDTLKKHRENCESFRALAAQTMATAHLAFPSVPQGVVRKQAVEELKKMKTVLAWKHNDIEFVCRLCPARRSKENMHSFIHHILGHLEDIELRTFRCGECGVFFALQSHFEAHKTGCEHFQCILRNGGAGPKDLWWCGRKFRSRLEFWRHFAGLGKSKIYQPCQDDSDSNPEDLADGDECHLLEQHLEVKLKRMIVDGIKNCGVIRAGWGVRFSSVHQ